LAIGIAVGFAAASIGALYTVFARYGIARGLTSPDLTFLRFAVAGVLTLPILVYHWRRDARALRARWRVWLVLCVLARAFVWLVDVQRLAARPCQPCGGVPLLGHEGVIAGVGTLFTYGKMVSILGPARAAVFPALAPGLAALMAWPVLDHVPTGAEALGLGLAMTGLVVAVTAPGLLGRIFSKFSFSLRSHS
jgi:drug/metabolite transporter (DMT)-like permease